MQITSMKYTDYLSRPEVSKEFNEMFEMNKNSFKMRNKEFGIDDEHLELLSIKVAWLETDFYFTDRHKELEGNKK